MGLDSPRSREPGASGAVVKFRVHAVKGAPSIRHSKLAFGSPGASNTKLPVTSEVGFAGWITIVVFGALVSAQKGTSAVRVLPNSARPAPPRVAPFTGNSARADELVVPPGPPLTSAEDVVESAT